ncbi:MAG: AMP-binding protein [Rhodospirillaceae bacterium]|nr:AMP-binding protein [Rhodospirillaceae bacterium]MBT4114983.1 AMP-binding protein [Rhodospirillaceae bacterium]MBT4748626.1 AMP-binding protein [Rhodospirillaceae bacterium]MBT5839289.1 AMP-binding protein [Rhodospirillaceae bacterium]MBT6289069.1 AMP-binding protein [Rhodospirillaceae bacterium]
MPGKKAEKTRANWLSVLEKHKHDADAPGSEEYWSPRLDCASRDELTAIQNEKLAALTPFLYENSGFYQRRFDRLGLAPTDIQSLDDLPKWPVVDKSEMMADVQENPPFGTYTTHDDDLWAKRGWMMFSSSGSTGVPRPFRYSQIDREYWSWANARAIHSFGIRPHDSMFICAGYGPHVFAWGVQYALAKMGVACIPGGGMNSDMRAMIVERFKPTVITSTPSYALHLGRVMEEKGMDPAKSSVKTLFIGGEPAAGIGNTRQRLEDLWGARLVEFYGCTEVAPHSGGYSCPASEAGPGPVTTHLMEDFQIWELVDDETKEPVPEGTRGLTVCTSLNSESSAQLRFLVGDYTTYTYEPCDCGRTHVRAVGAFAGRADDLINLRGIKMYPVQLEQAVRAVAGVGDEYEIVLNTNADGLDIMTARIEHAEQSAGDLVANEIRSRCEIRADVEVLALGTLPKTEFKAKRIRDERGD